MTQPPYGQQPPPPPQGQPYNPEQGQQYSPQHNPAQNPAQGQSYPAQQPVSTATTTGKPNLTAVVLAAVAAVLGVLSLFVLGWYRDNYSSVSGGSHTSGSSKFSKVHDALDQLQKVIDSNPGASKLIHLGISPIYFGWLGYLLIGVAVVLAIVAALPGGGAVMVLKVLAAIVALAGIGATLWAINLFSLDAAAQSRVSGGTPTGYGDWLKHTSFGAWAMGLAFLLCLISALLPPKRRAVITTNQPGQY